MSSQSHTEGSPPVRQRVIGKNAVTQQYVMWTCALSASHLGLMENSTEISSWKEGHVNSLTLKANIVQWPTSGPVSDRPQGIFKVHSYSNHCVRHWEVHDRNERDVVSFEKWNGFGSRKRDHTSQIMVTLLPFLIGNSLNSKPNQSPISMQAPLNEIANIKS